jgi:hypothetical protein
VFLFVPHISASRSMTGGAELSGPSGHRAVLFPLAHPLAHPLASDGWGRGYFCKKTKKSPRETKRPRLQSRASPTTPNPVPPQTLANPAAAAAQARGDARTARGGGGCGRREEAAGDGGIEQAISTSAGKLAKSD